jgi:hypothetical protein
MTRYCFVLLVICGLIACGDSPDMTATLHDDVQDSREEGSRAAELPRADPDLPDELPANPLDLSLPQEEITAGGEDGFSEEPLLPDLFEQNKKEEKKKVVVKGKVLLESSSEAISMDSIDGAEVSIEVNAD